MLLNDKFVLAIEDDPCRSRSSARRTAFWWWDSDYQWGTNGEFPTVAIIECGLACAIVRDPPGASGAVRQSPGIDQVRIGKSGNTVQI